MFEMMSTFKNAKMNKNLINSLLSSQKIKKKWRVIVGEVLYKDLEFQYILHDYCEVMVNSSAWLSEIKFYENQIIKKINYELKSKQKVKRLQLVLNPKIEKQKNRTFAKKRNYDNMIGR
tara:strand:- start:32 stop:388 length:357 start_codon:yes stop_codon:yes gene_type:complete